MVQACTVKRTVGGVSFVIYRSEDRPGSQSFEDRKCTKQVEAGMSTATVIIVNICVFFFEQKTAYEVS